MNKYEAMCIIKPDLPEQEKKNVISQAGEIIAKSGGSVQASVVWAEKKKLHFPIKKCHEGTYVLVNFTSPPLAIKDIRQAYSLNENILRALFTRQE